MRKQFVLFVVLVLLFALGGCDDRQDEIDALEARLAEYAQYDELIGYIENDDYEAAEELLGAYALHYRNEQVRTGDIVSVEINSDNWAEYFEIRELTQWCENDFGEPTGFITHVSVVLREDYADRIVTAESYADFRWEALCSVKNCSVDAANQMVSIENVFGSSSTSFGDPEVLSGTFSFDGRFSDEEFLAEQNVVGKIGEIVVIGEYSLDGEMKSVCFDYENAAITQAQGVLMLMP